MSQAQIDNARKYVARVKEMYGSDSRQYRGFLEALREYRSRQLEPLDVIDRIAQLFKGDRSLIIGFNAFLPEEVSTSSVLQGHGMSVPFLIFLQVSHLYGKSSPNATSWQQCPAKE